MVGTSVSTTRRISSAAAAAAAAGAAIAIATIAGNQYVRICSAGGASSAPASFAQSASAEMDLFRVTRSSLAALSLLNAASTTSVTHVS